MLKTPTSRYKHARDLCLTYTSVGGGVVLALFIFRVFSAIENMELFSWTFIITMIIVMIHFIRLYWQYLNTIVFFAPIPNLILFVNDTLAFFFAGLTILFIGQLILCFISMGLALIFCVYRGITCLHHTREYGIDKLYPIEYNFEKKHHPKFAKLHIPLVLFCFGNAIIFWIFEYEMLSFTSSLIYLILVTLISLYYIDPVFPFNKNISKIK